MLLDFLITSRTRKSLLALLLEGLEASVHDLSQLVDAAYAATYDELKAMKKEGLVKSRKEGRATLYSLNDDYAELKLLKTLFQESSEMPTPATSLPQPGDAKANLVAYGAPLLSANKVRKKLQLEEALVVGVLYSKKESSLLRTLPVALWRNKESLNLEKLRHFSEKYGVKEEVGFVLDLTGYLSGDRTLSREARAYRDGRRSKSRSFFEEKEYSEVQKELEELNTPELSKKWHFTMNMGMDSFQSFFDKFKVA